MLAGPLAFRPLYARTGHLWRSRYFGIRLKARLKGIGRLLLGRFPPTPRFFRKASTPRRMLQWAIARQIVLRL
ncbi:hypothetical protein [Leptolyngbya sp. O-77]|uniref:hypothetical protein n=1 Tax=Leptolyngbya sp. O-77 TaxID=1080068 RepID=UPI000AF82610|nr:hypothetical protein [Leptolyngbya sp. O-77]